MSPFLRNDLPLLLVFVVVLSITTSTEEGFAQPKHRRVRIRNLLENTTEILRVHCKSKDDDIGWHDLVTRESFTFEFYSNMGGTTLLLQI
ncbi:putative plant self-incompatibility S1 [Rosa chinensis]|uniref:S-protein homolog n=1 Tax=Rosa chinensis TaxID=74649 RepID=A0A2P6QRW3_ROSCH|nr:putative plant self-incompatibility S1 [Rosa chinensis]